MRDDNVILESTESAGTYRPGDDDWGTGLYRLEVCCDDPGYDDCRWKTFAGPVLLSGTVGDLCPVTCTWGYTCISGQVYINASGFINDPSCLPTEILLDGVPHPFEIVPFGPETIWQLTDVSTNQTPKNWPQCEPHSIEVKTECGTGCKRILAPCIACLNATVLSVDAGTVTRSYSWTANLGATTETVTVNEVVEFPGMIATRVNNGCSTVIAESVAAPGAYSVTITVSRTGSWTAGSLQTANFEITEGDLLFTLNGSGLSVAPVGQRTINASYTFFGGGSSSQSGRSDWSGLFLGKTFGLADTPIVLSPCTGGAASGSTTLRVYPNTAAPPNCLYWLYDWSLFITTPPGSPPCTTLGFEGEVTSL